MPSGPKTSFVIESGTCSSDTTLYEGYYIARPPWHEPSPGSEMPPEEPMPQDDELDEEPEDEEWDELPDEDTPHWAGWNFLTATAHTELSAVHLELAGKRARTSAVTRGSRMKCRRRTSTGTRR